MSKITASQSEAINNPGNTLVMAGAGTGKTTTLVNRVLHWITGGGHSIDRLLLVTFTEAAAAEMRQRLRKALIERLGSASRDEVDRLHEQLALLEQARISTLHSFCLNLIREHFHLLGIDPDLRVLDEKQTRPMEERVLDDLFAEHYAGKHEDSVAVQHLVRVQGNGSEWTIRGQVLTIHRFVRTLANPAEWMADQLGALQSPEPTDWKGWLEARVDRWRTETIARLEPIAAQHEWAALALDGVRATVDPTEEFELDALFDAIRKPAARWPNNVDPAIKDPVNECYEDAAWFASFFAERDGRSGLERDWDECRRGLLPLLGLVRNFGERFARAKREMGGIDFADQEQLALELLRDDANGVAAHCRSFFQQVMIDEAQDINHAQDAILRAVSADNRFVVGDVKQCIYQFRLTDPEIFQRQAEEWRVKETGRVVPLTDNFRSREGVLDFVNALFEDLMIPEVGGMAYDESARLGFGSKLEGFSKADDERQGTRAEIHILSMPAEEKGAAADEDRRELLAVEQEARLIAHRLFEVKESGLKVWDKDIEAFRRVEWRDMVVLLRSPGPCAEAFVREFRRFGVPLLAKRAGFYSAIEVRDLLNLLTLLDNPEQDLPLLAVLRSPLAGFSPEELARIRVDHHRLSVWRSVRRYAHDGEAEGLRAKVGSFLEQYAEWRALSRQSSLSHCLEVVLEQTHYEALLLISDRGEERVGNVRRLLTLAHQFDPWQRQGLHRFVRFVERQQEADIDLEPAPPSAAEAVTLMSVHQSKGLEYPVVAIAGLGRKFNETDLNASLVLDEQYGLCPAVYPDGSDHRYPSLPMELARERRRTALRAEEGRLLYVASTRARELLVLCGVVNPSQQKVSELMARDLSPGRIGRAASMLEWLLPWIGRHASAEAIERGFGEMETCRWCLRSDLPEPEQESGGTGDKTPSCEVDREALADRLEFQYPFAGATIEAAKTSVSELRRRSREVDDTAGNRFRTGRGFQVESPERAKLTSAERGSIHHRFLQHVDLARVASPQELRAQANRLTETGVLEPDDAGVIDFEGLAGFFVSPLGRRIRSGIGRVERELPFTVRLRAKELADLGVTIERQEMTDEDFVVVQGVVDLILIGDDELVILDYKTDAVKGDGIVEKVREYRPQLRLYALALERILNRHAAEAWLHFVNTGESVNVLAS